MSLRASSGDTGHLITCQRTASQRRLGRGGKRPLIIAGWDMDCKRVPEPHGSWERWAEAELFIQRTFQHSLCVENILLFHKVPTL